jgi:hypothetical protein
MSENLSTVNEQLDNTQPSELNVLLDNIHNAKTLITHYKKEMNNSPNIIKSIDIRKNINKYKREYKKLQGDLNGRAVVDTISEPSDDGEDDIDKDEYNHDDKEEEEAEEVLSADENAQNEYIAKQLLLEYEKTKQEEFKCKTSEFNFRQAELQLKQEELKLRQLELQLGVVSTSSTSSTVGPTGPAGPQGEQGIEGPTGPAGPQGVSASGPAPVDV